MFLPLTSSSALLRATILSYLSFRAQPRNLQFVHPLTNAEFNDVPSPLSSRLERTRDFLLSVSFLRIRNAEVGSFRQSTPRPPLFVIPIRAQRAEGPAVSSSPNGC
jgi:hypothetical protein